MQRKGEKEMACTHPAICDGVCLVCHEKVGNKADKPPEREIVKEEPEQPVKAQETAKKTTRKRKG
jgi:hypothetical protein